jgi:hypothetical protein
LLLTIAGFVYGFPNGYVVCYTQPCPVYAKHV